MSAAPESNVPPTKSEAFDWSRIGERRWSAETKLKLLALLDEVKSSGKFRGPDPVALLLSDPSSSSAPDLEPAQPLLFPNLSHSPALVPRRRPEIGRRAADRFMLAKLRRAIGFSSPETEPTLLDFIKRNRP